MKASDLAKEIQRMADYLQGLADDERVNKDYLDDVSVIDNLLTELNDFIVVVEEYAADPEPEDEEEEEEEETEGSEDEEEEE